MSSRITCACNFFLKPHNKIKKIHTTQLNNLGRLAKKVFFSDIQSTDLMKHLYFFNTPFLYRYLEKKISLCSFTKYCFREKIMIVNVSVEKFDSSKNIDCSLQL